jgi:hypothetical protein
MHFERLFARFIAVLTRKIRPPFEHNLLHINNLSGKQGEKNTYPPPLGE